jgi:CBS domain-containing protein
VATGFAIALIGWFLSRFATTAYRWEAMRRTVDGVRVGEVMERDAPTVRPSLTLDVFVDQYLLSGSGSAFAVTDADALIGTIDVDRARRVPREQWPSRRIADVMTPIDDVRTAHEDDPLWPAIESFERERLHVMPVLEGGRLVGVLTRDGLLSVIRGRARLVTR